jgi:2-polyprenyl-3-methyl-5-hydroxy-6-metoxy-1,4-benzoquinol methylase
MRELISLNPTYDSAWFTKDTVDPDFEFPITKCETCAFNFSKYTLKDDLQFRYYNESILAEKSRQKIYKKEKREFLLEVWYRLNQLNQGNGSISLVDYGAGWGDFLAIAKCHGVNVFGLEFDKRKIDFANSAQVPLGDFRFLHENAPYNVFMCNQVLEHLNKPAQALQDLRAIVEKDAVGFISVPNFNEERMRQQEECIKNAVPTVIDLDPVGHLNYFTPEHLKRMVEQCGFVVVDSFGDHIPNFWERLKERSKKQTTSIFVKAI